MTEINRDNFDDCFPGEIKEDKGWPKTEIKEYKGLPETKYKDICHFQSRRSGNRDAFVKKSRRFVYAMFILNVTLTLMNLGSFVFFGWHWYNLVAAIFCGSVALWIFKQLKNSPHLQYDEEIR